MTTAAAFGQANISPAPKQIKTIVITGGTIHTGNGQIIENGTIVFKNGKILSVGSGNPEVEAGTESALCEPDPAMVIYTEIPE